MKIKIILKEFDQCGSLPNSLKNMTNRKSPAMNGFTVD